MSLIRSKFINHDEAEVLFDGSTGTKQTIGDNTTKLATDSFVFEGLATKEPTISAGTTLQYWRGDKSWQTHNIDSLTNVTTLTPIVDQALVWNGAEWVNKSVASVSTGLGVQFYLDDTAIIPTGTDNVNEMVTTSKTPITTVEVVDTISCANNTVLKESYLYNTALGRTSIDAGEWMFNTYCSVSSVLGGRVSSIRINMMRVRPEVPTVTITGTGTSRTATASGDTPFATTKIDTGGTIDSDSYLMTPKGLYRITARTSDTVVTITTPTTYVNESAVSLNVWKRLFQNSTGTITALTTNYSLIQKRSVQEAFVIETTDKLGTQYFGVSNNTTDIYFTHNGSNRYSNFRSTLTWLHNDLTGLQGGSASERYHISQNSYDNLALKNAANIFTQIQSYNAHPSFTPGSNQLADIKYVDDAVGVENLWDRVTGTPNYVLPHTAADDVGATAARITKGWFTSLDSSNMPTINGTTIKSVINTSVNTWSSQQTFNSVNEYVTETGITAYAGGGQANATQLTKEYNHVTVCATGNDSVRLLLVNTVGQKLTVKNSGVASLRVFPQPGAYINSLAVNIGYDIPPGASIKFLGTAPSYWQTVGNIVDIANIFTGSSNVFNNVVEHYSDVRILSSGQLRFSSGSTSPEYKTIAFPWPAATRQYFITDMGADADYVFTAGAQTFTGLKTFTTTATFSGNDASPDKIHFYNASATTDEKYWIWNTENDGTCYLGYLNDAKTMGGYAINTKRTGITIDEINLFGTNTNVKGALNVGTAGADSTGVWKESGGVTIFEIDADTIPATANVIINGSIKAKCAEKTAAYNPSALTTDYEIAYTTTGTAYTYTISTEDIQSGSLTQPRHFLLRDKGGDASTNNFTVAAESGTVYGANVLATNYGVIWIETDGTNVYCSQ